MAWRRTVALIAGEHHTAKARGIQPDRRKLDGLRRQLKFERCAEYFEQLLADPAPTREQREHLAAILTGATALAEAESPVTAADVIALDLDAGGLLDSGLGGGLRGGDAA